ncbi:MAG TPA: NAD(P)/FAD-dependent oxidoreductase [Kosmotogaceae bacterium]|nr:NAD(P)/FAD-dependent oxidoreductase [Kosmotogaceae bacterium]
MESYDAIVVGGGITGLTSAVYLARGGAKTLLLEKNDRGGGLGNSFIREGFLFDGGVRALESAGIILPMLKELGIDLEIVKSPVSVGIENSIIHISSKENLKDYENLLKNLYPDHGEDIDRVISVIKKIMKHIEVLYGVDNPLFKDLKSNMAELGKVYLPWLFKFPFTLRSINKLKMPVEDLLGKIVKDRSLNDMISQHFFKNTPAFFAMSYFYLYQDYFYPLGGVGGLAESIGQKIQEFGGSIITHREVRELSPDTRTIVDHKGSSYKYDQLIWAADLKQLYKVTKTEGLPKEVAQEIDEKKDQLLSKHGAESVFSVFIAVDEPPESFKAISNGHFFYSPSRKGLGEIHRSELRSLLENLSETSQEDISSWLDRFCEFNTYEISIPVLKDNAAAPEGKTGLIVSLLLDYNLAKKATEQLTHKVFKEELENRMISTLSNSIYPMLKDKIIFSFSASPLNIEDYAGSSEGSIIGWSFEEEIPVTSSLLKGSSSVNTPIPNVLQAGKWAYSPSGVPMCILTGKLAANRALKHKKPSHKK